MVLRRLRPTPGQLAALLARCPSMSLTYEPAGVTLQGWAPAGLPRRTWATDLPDHAFELGAEAIRTWAVHLGAGLEVAADGPMAVGTNVALAAKLPVGWIEATCRIVAVVDEPDRRGFAYGTLGIHPEQGEEAFLVQRGIDGVAFAVVAVSRPAHPLARLVPPVAHRLQDRAVERYLTTMQRLIGRER